MTFYYSSLFFDKQINSLRDLSQYENVTLILDTNTCVYLRDFYDTPNYFVESHSSIMPDFLNFLGEIQRYNFNIEIGLGIDESCRNLEDFSLNQPKKEAMLNSVTSMLSVDIESLINRNYYGDINQIKDSTRKTNSKISSLNQDSAFSGLNIPSYACMLKIYTLNEEVKKERLSKLDSMKKIIRFMDEEIDLVGATVLSFALNYFGENPDFRKILKKKAKNKEAVLHNIWNAALDICFPILVSSCFSNDNGIPVLVTSDKGLNSLTNSLKLESVFTSNGKITNDPQLTSFEEKNTTWTNEELLEIENIINNLQIRRLLKLSKIEKSDEAIEKMMKIIADLEKQILEL